jgi:hypothetical protein
MWMDTESLHDGLLRTVELVPPGMSVGDVLPEVTEYLEAVIQQVNNTTVLIH